jgi:hypothetical protein
MVDLAYDWSLMGWGMRAIVIALAIALAIVLVSPHVAVLKPVAERLGLVAVTTQTIYVPVNHTVYVNQTIVKYVYVNKTVPVYMNRTVYVNETVYANPFHVNYTCWLDAYVFLHNMTIGTIGYMTPSVAEKIVVFPSNNAPLLAILPNPNVTSINFYTGLYYNGTIYFPPFNAIINMRAETLLEYVNPKWNGTWLLIPNNIPPFASSYFVNVYPCNVTIYIEK